MGLPPYEALGQRFEGTREQLREEQRESESEGPKWGGRTEEREWGK